MCTNRLEIGSLTVHEQARKAYISIGEVSRILLSSWNQANEEVFTSGYAGVQCCSMVLANIVRAVILPREWSTNTLDMNMLEGDGCYQAVRILSEYHPQRYPIEADGYLSVCDFDVIKTDFLMFNESFSIEYADESPLYGSLQDAANMNIDTAQPLKDSLNQLFQENNAEVLITTGKSLGVMLYDEKYYFTDSHSCGSKGAAATNGRGCIIECDTHWFAKRTIHARLHRC